MTTEREVSAWSCRRDEELLSANCIEDAVDEYVDHIFPYPLPEEVTVYGFARMELPAAHYLAGRILQYVSELLDEDFGDPDGEDSAPTRELEDAALVFAEKIREEYVPWACEEVTSQTVKIADYVNVEEYAENVRQHEERKRRSNLKVE